MEQVDFEGKDLLGEVTRRDLLRGAGALVVMGVSLQLLARRR